MKTLKKLTALLMVLAMAFALSVTALATEGNTATLTINIAGTQESSTVNLLANDTVYSVVDRTLGNRASWTSTTPDADYSPLRDSTSPLYDTTANAQILSSLDGYASAPYTPSSAVEEYEDYVVGSDVTLDYYHNLYLEDYGGIAMWIGGGMAIMGDNVHMMYIGSDWTYTVNGSAPGIAITPDDSHPYDFFQYYMNEALVGAGDEIVLAYGLQALVF